MSRNLMPEILVVRDADLMDSHDFALHMTHRHLDSLGGLKYLRDNMGDYVEGCYRTFHDRLHATRIDLEHEHAGNNS